jgi:hypothetical protein
MLVLGLVKTCTSTGLLFCFLTEKSHLWPEVLATRSGFFMRYPVAIPSLARFSGCRSGFNGYLFSFYNKVDTT